ncbi:MAG: response regulator transcription factor [Lewinellaceae bacterium]|nr:response regulator transcription factor [Saprospiraceae bacterium]MCB9337469.1 response regulator transcription factor [Lewinellaceae bacterium]
MTITCLVIDDEPVARKGIAGYVEQVPFLSLAGTCKGALEANEMLHEHQVDLLFLDIQMPDLTGTEFVRSLEHPPAVIFTTAYRDYAIEGFELNALDYLVKPISFQRFLKAANKAKHHFEMQRQPLPKPPTADPGYFFIKSDGQFIKIKLDDVLFFESEKDYVFIYTPLKRYMTLLSLKQLESELPPDKFLRVHRSFIVSLDKIELMDGNMLIIKDKRIPVSRSLQDTIFNTLIAGRLWKRDV